MNLPLLYIFPSNWSWMKIHLYWQLSCRVELTSWLPLWAYNIPVLVCESTFCNTSLVLLYLMSQLDSECYLNFLLASENCHPVFILLIVDIPLGSKVR